MSNTIQIVLGLYDPRGTYCRHVGVLLTSLFSRTQSRVHVSLLHDATLTDDNRARLSRTAEKFGQKIEFRDISSQNAWMSGNIEKLMGRFTRGALFRLLIPEFVPSAKAIYLDCDIAVNLDIAELWAVDVDGVSLAAIPDNECFHKHMSLNDRLRYRVMRCSTRNYFNSGVLVMNLERIRGKYDLAEEAVRFFDRYRSCSQFADQDFLNVLFQGDVRLIDEHFNRIEDSRNIENGILHLTGKSRPWTAHRRSVPRDYFYWRTFAESEWRDQLVDTMMELNKNNPAAHYHTADCFRNIGNRWKRDLLCQRLIRHVIFHLQVLLILLQTRISDFRYRMSKNDRQ